LGENGARAKRRLPAKTGATRSMTVDGDESQRGDCA
jgi:hypothetical protein